MTTALLILVAGVIAMMLVFSDRARRAVCTGVSGIARIEKKHHVFSGAGALLLALAALAAVGGLLLMWALRLYDGFLDGFG